jgi:hypothetical protein
MKYLEQHTDAESTIYTFKEVESLTTLYPTLFYPVYKLQIHMMKYSLGTYWWETHKAQMLDQKEEHIKQIKAAEKLKLRATEVSKEADMLNTIKLRLGIRYYLMPWLIAIEKKKLLRIAAIEQELDVMTSGNRQRITFVSHDVVHDTTTR